MTTRERHYPDSVAKALYDATSMQWNRTYMHRTPEEGDGYHAYISPSLAQVTADALNYSFRIAAIPGFKESAINVKPLNNQLSALVIPYTLTQTPEFEAMISDVRTIGMIARELSGNSILHTAAALQRAGANHTKWGSPASRQVGGRSV